MAIHIAPKPSKLEAQRALLAGAKPDAPVKVAAVVSGLSALVQKAASQLASARTAAEVLDARDSAATVYDAAKRAARIVTAKGAHDELIAKAHRAQADALEIEAGAKRRLADEYDAVQPEKARKGGRPKSVPDQNGFTAKEAGVTRKLVHEARRVRDAEIAKPGVVADAVSAALDDGKEPTRALVNEAIAEALGESRQAAPLRNFYDDLVSLYCAAPVEDREAFVAYLRVSGAITEAPTARPGEARASLTQSSKRSAPEKFSAQEPSEPEGSGGVQDECAIHPATPFFTNPRCQQPDTCHFVHTRDDCFDCSLAWSKRPKEEQTRLWAEANKPVEVAA